MPYPDDLLEQAKHLANRERTRPRQASLRRAVSTAYYALFHLLVREATLNWKRADQRALFARFFEHGKMKAASEKRLGEISAYLKTNPPQGHDFDCATHLGRVTDAFSQAQQLRHSADYDNSRIWQRGDVQKLIDRVEAAFQSWHRIREEPAAQSYLISLLGNPKG